MWDKHSFFLVNHNTYYNTHENSYISVLNRVYNKLHNQSTITKWPNLCSCFEGKMRVFHSPPMGLRKIILQVRIEHTHEPTSDTSKLNTLWVFICLLCLTSRS